jgi:hypothetical protein|tara:strand:+ start:57 stop:272 length:216 start_codon:yes stop_codon:yes gene_type:complete
MNITINITQDPTTGDITIAFDEGAGYGTPFKRVDPNKWVAVNGGLYVDLHPALVAAAEHQIQSLVGTFHAN